MVGMMVDQGSSHLMWKSQRHTIVMAVRPHKFCGTLSPSALFKQPTWTPDKAIQPWTCHAHSQQNIPGKPRPSGCLSSHSRHALPATGWLSAPDRGAIPSTGDRATSREKREKRGREEGGPALTQALQLRVSNEQKQIMKCHSKAFSSRLPVMPPLDMPRQWGHPPPPSSPPNQLAGTM